jgi:adenylylsulfate kinase
MLNKNIVWHNHLVNRKDREEIKSQKGVVLWFTGLSGSGKSTIANALEFTLYKMGYHTYLLDGDNIRHGLNSDLGFSKEDRKENIRRVGEVSKLFVDAGIITITAFISPFIDDRKRAKNIVGESNFIEVFIDTPLEVCAKRDPKGLYKKVKDGEIKEFTGVHSPYEKPIAPDIHIETLKMDIEESSKYIIDYLKNGGYIKDV